jgi:signal transduction histidine kinase
VLSHDLAAAPARHAGSTWLWAAAFGLGACALLALLVGAVLVRGSGKPAEVLVTIVGAALAVLLLVTLGVLRQRHSTADGTAAQREQRAEALERHAAELSRRAEEQQAQYAAMMTALTQAVDDLADVQLPAALNGSAVRPLSDSAPADGGAAELCRRVTAAAVDGAVKLRENLDDQIDSSRLAAVRLARRVQASAHRIQEEATRMADRHPGDPTVLESSMRVDHAAAQQARHAQSVAVLCGEWPGQQWPQPLALVDVVRAAASRIVAYKRVAVSGEPDTAASASIVEQLIHLVAELLANAAQSSPPTTQVLVTVRTVQRGAVIEMDDGGVGMEEHQLEQAREIVSGQRLLGLGDLSEVPQTGLAVIGQYARRHGFRVDLMPSPYGGVRAVVLVPAEMVVTLEPAALPPPSLPAPEFRPALTELADSGAEAGASAGSLPQRRSRRGESEPALHSGRAPEDPALPAQTPEQAGEWMAAYFTGSASDADAAGSVAPAASEDDLAASPGNGPDDPGSEQA